jgi:uncharacterized protein
MAPPRHDGEKNCFARTWRRCCLATIFLSSLAAATAMAQSQPAEVLRLGTGPTDGTYYRIGGLIAAAISSPPGARPCDRGGSCGVPGKIFTAQSSDGSVENLELLLQGRLDLAIAQADIAALAREGAPPFRERGPTDKLRVLARLFDESVHVVVRSNGPIQRIEDLARRRVALGPQRSGTVIAAEAIFRTFGISTRDFEVHLRRPAEAAEMLQAGTIDALFMIAGVPVTTVSELANSPGIRLLPLAGQRLDPLLMPQAPFAIATIPEGAYTGIAATPTLSIAALLLARADLEESLAYAIVTSIWNEQNRASFAAGHPRGRDLSPARAVLDLPVPLHPGAERYYREMGFESNSPAKNN